MAFAQLQSIRKSALQLSLISLIFFSFSLSANAQVYGQALDVTFTPVNPGPGDRISVTVKDVVGNLDEKEIIWTLNGKIEKRGIGEKNFEFDLGPLGSVSTVKVTTNVLSKTIQIRPTEVDIIWESDGYAPPFYKGKVLRVYQSGLRLVAIPNFISSAGDLIDRTRLVYNWRNSGVLNAPGSGYAKSLLIYPGSTITRPLKMAVEVSSIDGTHKGGEEIVVEATEPLVFLYEDHPLYGTQYNKSLNDAVLELQDREVRVAAVPLYFSTANKADEKLKYSWNINGFAALNKSFRDSVVLRREGDLSAQTSNQSNVRLQLDNQEEFMQSYIANFRVKFQ